MEQYVVSRKLAEKLQEAGYSQDTQYHIGYDDVLVTALEMDDDMDYYAAPCPMSCWSSYQPT